MASWNNWDTECIFQYRKTSNIRPTLVSNKIVDHSNVVGVPPAALLQLHLHSRLNTWFQWIEQRQLQDKTRNIQVLGFGATYIRVLTVCPEIINNYDGNISALQ